MSTLPDSPWRGCVVAYDEPLNKAKVIGSESMVDWLVYNPPHDQKKKQVSTETLCSVMAYSEYYITGAFRSFRKNEAYIFMDDEYVLFNYAPSMKDNCVIDGPHYIRNGFPAFMDTTFGECGIECGFGSHDGKEEFIFFGHQCACVDFAALPTNDEIIEDWWMVTDIFPFLKGTVFESGADAAFEGHKKYEAYLFNGNQYALINYKSLELIAAGPISQGFGCLKGTIFEDEIDAAFASHEGTEAYLFKEDCCALIDFANDKMLAGGVKKILDNWPSLRSVLPRKCLGGLDGHVV